MAGINPNALPRLSRFVSTNNLNLLEVSTLLRSKGYKDLGPNSVLTQEQYDIIATSFPIALKENPLPVETPSIEVPKIPKLETKPVVAAPPVSVPAPEVDSNAANGPKVLRKIELPSSKKPIKEKIVEEKPIVPTAIIEEKKENTSAEIPKDIPVSTPANALVASDTSTDSTAANKHIETIVPEINQPRILGKIDLGDSKLKEAKTVLPTKLIKKDKPKEVVNNTTKTDRPKQVVTNINTTVKKDRPTYENTPKQTPKPPVPEIPKKEEPVVQAAAPIIEPEKPKEHIGIQVDLGGPKVLRKIELAPPPAAKKYPSKEDFKKNKEKRKRLESGHKIGSSDITTLDKKDATAIPKDRPREPYNKDRYNKGTNTNHSTTNTTNTNGTTSNTNNNRFQKPGDRPNTPYRDRPKTEGTTNNTGGSTTNNNYNRNTTNTTNNSNPRTTTTGTSTTPNKPATPGTTTPATNNFRDAKPKGGDKRFDKDKKRKDGKLQPNQGDVQKQVKATLAKMNEGGIKSKSSKYKRDKRQEGRFQREEKETLERESTVISCTEFISASDLSILMDVNVTQIIAACMSIGLFVSINQRLDSSTIEMVASNFGFQVQFVSIEEQEDLGEIEDTEEDLAPRPPVVTVMGHVDHGKTSLLDYIRKANVIAGEAGGITQHIGAYSVKLESGKRITFLDTPGHEAFTAMRARGAKLTDIAIIVIACDDSVMPQTIEAINHAQAAGVPIVFAFNKMDKPGAAPEKIREQLSAMNILVEEWGGKYQTQEVSAKKGINITELLDKVLLESEFLNVRANPVKNAVGTVIESSLDKGRGYVTNILVQTGIVRVGDAIIAGCYSGKVKAMFNERGQKIKEAGPSTPVTILGLSGAPTAGDKFNMMDDEKKARDIASKRLQVQREQSIRTQKHITLDEIGRRIAIGDFQELNLIVKGDVDGSIEALSDALLRLSTEKIQIKIIHKSVGQINESDVLLASASDAIIVGFQVRPSTKARQLAEQESIDIRAYSIIYDAINEIKDAMEGMLAPVRQEQIIGNVEVREVFKITKVGTVAGCYVLDGKVTRNGKVRIIRDGIVLHTGELGSLKRFKDDVKEVGYGYECGLNFNNYNDLKEGDLLEIFDVIEVKAKL